MKTGWLTETPMLLLLLASLGSCDLFGRIGGQDPLDDVVRNNPVDPGVSTPIDTGLQPADGETIGHTTPVFQWLAFDYVDSYRLQVSERESFEGALLADIAEIETSHYHLTTPLDNGRTYYWRVQPRYADGTQGGWSSTWSVTIRLPIPVATAPASGASVNTPRPTLAWGAEAEAAQYLVEVGDSADLTLGLVEEATVAGPSYQIVTLLEDAGVYYWRVRIVDSEGILGEWSETSSYSISFPQPELIAPQSGEASAERAPLLDWLDVPDAVVYHLQLGLTDDFSAGILYDTQDPTSSEFLVPADLAAHTQYYWRVRAAYGALYFGKWSEVAGLEVSAIIWKHDTGYHLWSTPALGYDGTIYLPSTGEGFVALDPDGSIKWRYDEPRIREVAVGPDGDIYAVSPANLIAFDPDGAVKWSYPLWNGTYVCPAVAVDGTIYVAAGSSLCALDPDGVLQWSAALAASGTLTVDPVIGPDGTIYIPAEGSLRALNPDGSQKWAVPVSWAPEFGYAVDRDGSVYVPGVSGYASLTAIDANGSPKWTFDPPNHTYGNSPVIGEDGTIYLGMKDTLYAINPDGSERWHLILADAPNVADVYSTVALGADGTLYFGTGGVTTGKGNTLTAVDPDGSIQWQEAAPRTDPWYNYFFGTPTIGPDGTVYVGSGDGCLYAIETFSPGLAASPWPMYRHDAQHTGRIDP